MISNFLRLPDTNVFYLQGFFKTEEIELDHLAGDHVEAVVLTEICRQACMCTAEVVLTGQEYLIPTEEMKMYKRFISPDKPLLIQVITMMTTKHRGYSVFNLYQEGRCCLKGYMLGRVLKSKHHFKELRAKENG